MVETVFLDLESIRYTWKDSGNGVKKINKTQIETSDLSIGIISEKSALQLNLDIKALFIDLGETLVTLNKSTGKYVEFPETNTILKSLEDRGLGIGIISDGNRSQINSLLADPTLLDRFNVVVMSGDKECWSGSKSRRQKSLTRP